MTKRRIAGGTNGSGTDRPSTLDAALAIRSGIEGSIRPYPTLGAAMAARCPRGGEPHPGLGLSSEGDGGAIRLHGMVDAGALAALGRTIAVDADGKAIVAYAEVVVAIWPEEGCVAITPVKGVGPVDLMLDGAALAVLASDVWLDMREVAARREETPVPEGELVLRRRLEGLMAATTDGAMPITSIGHEASREGPDDRVALWPSGSRDWVGPVAGAAAFAASLVPGRDVWARRPGSPSLGSSWWRKPAYLLVERADGTGSATMAAAGKATAAAARRWTLAWMNEAGAPAGLTSELVGRFDEIARGG